ncbi:unnamed protein product [Rhodiola kirilowii]
MPPRLNPFRSLTTINLPSIPSLELKVGSETDMTKLEKNIQSLVNYNNILRENLKCYSIHAPSLDY